MLGKLLPFRRRTKSKYADDKAVEDFASVYREQGLELDYERIKELITDPGEGEEGIAELAKLLGQDDPNKDRFRG